MPGCFNRQVCCPAFVCLWGRRDRDKGTQCLVGQLSQAEASPLCLGSNLSQHAHWFLQCEWREGVSIQDGEMRAPGHEKIKPCLDLVTGNMSSLSGECWCPGGWLLPLCGSLTAACEGLELPVWCFLPLPPPPPPPPSNRRNLSVRFLFKLHKTSVVLLIRSHYILSFAVTVLRKNNREFLSFLWHCY